MKLKKLLCGSLALILAMSMSACAKKEAKKDDKKEPVVEKKLSLEEKVYNAYSKVLENPRSYEFGDEIKANDESVEKFGYEIVYMQGKSFPQLLLYASLPDQPGIEAVRAFSYDEKNDKLVEPKGVFYAGVAPVGGARGAVDAVKEGTHLITSEFSSGTGEGTIDNITIDGDMLKRETVFEGNVYEKLFGGNSEQETIFLYFLDVGDKSKLEEYKKGNLKSNEDLLKINTNIEATGKVGGNQSTDSEKSGGNSEEEAKKSGKQVLKGKVYVLNHQEVLDMQGIPDPNPGSDNGETYVVLKLDSPTKVLASSGSGSGEQFSNESKLIQLTDANASKYEGKSIKIAVDASDIFWPSDTSLPAGEPSTSKYEVVK